MRRRTAHLGAADEWANAIDGMIYKTYSGAIGARIFDIVEQEGAIAGINGGVLHAYESLTKENADALGIRDAVCFQTENVLITNDGENVTPYYAEYNTGMVQRTAIAQRADGAVLLVVTDGRMMDTRYCADFF